MKSQLMRKKIVKTSSAPAPIGPYNQATLANGTLYASGQIAIIPETGKLLQGNIQEETKQVMENLKAVLNAEEMTFDNIVKVSIFISNMDNFVAINEIYAQYFDDETAPARETVEVARLPKDVNVEISLIAVQ